MIKYTKRKGLKPSRTDQVRATVRTNIISGEKFRPITISTVWKCST